MIASLVNENVKMFHLHQYGKKDASRLLKNLNDNIDHIIDLENYNIESQQSEFFLKYQEKKLRIKHKKRLELKSIIYLI